jgi:hypothetical protein
MLDLNQHEDPKTERFRQEETSILDLQTFFSIVKKLIDLPWFSPWTENSDRIIFTGKFTLKF